MRPGNVEIDGVAHARAHSERAITRCGLLYLRPGTNDAIDAHVGRVLRLSVGVETKEDVSCMTCMTKDEWENADPFEANAYHLTQEIADKVDDEILAELMATFAKDVR